MRKIIQTLKNVQDLDQIVLIVLALIAGVLSAFGFTGQDIVLSAILAVLAGLLFGQLRVSRSFAALNEQTAFPIRGFAESREKLAPLRERLNSSKSGIQILGIQLGSMGHEYLQLLEDQLRRGRRVQLLLMSPLDDAGNPLPWVDESGRVHTFANLQQVLSVNIQHLRNWCSSLEPELATKVEIRSYRSIPTVSMIIVDGDKSHGWVQVEPLLYRMPPSQRPNFTVTRSSSPSLYGRLLASYGALWQASEPV